MKNYIALLIGFILINGCAAYSMTLKDRDGNLVGQTKTYSDWVASCGTTDFTKPSKDKYIFIVKKGKVGPCDSDKVKQDHGYGNKWDWSERSEVKTNSIDMWGKWEWSATIYIDRQCQPAQRNAIFQVHAGGYLVNPPSWFGINEWNMFRHNQKGNRIGSISPVPNSPFKLKAKINATKEDVKVDYFVNDKFITSTYSQAPEKYTNIFFKFGVYRVNSNCDIKQTYTNVKLERVE